MNKRGAYWLNWLKGLDYFTATWFGIPAGIYVSSYVAFKKADTYNRWQWVVAEKVLNWMFRDENHCINSMNNNLEDIQRYYY